MDAFGNKSYEDAVIVHKSKLELEKEAGVSLAHKSIRTLTRAELHMMCAPPASHAPAHAAAPPPTLAFGEFVACALFNL